MVFLGHQGGGNQEIRGRPVAGHRDIPDDGDPEEGLDVGVVGHRLEGIPEEDQEIDRPVGDPRPDLLIPAERAALEAADLEPHAPVRSRAPVVPVAKSS